MPLQTLPTSNPDAACPPSNKYFYPTLAVPPQKKKCGNSNIAPESAIRKKGTKKSDNEYPAPCAEIFKAQKEYKNIAVHFRRGKRPCFCFFPPPPTCKQRIFFFGDTAAWLTIYKSPQKSTASCLCLHKRVYWPSRQIQALIRAICAKKRASIKIRDVPPISACAVFSGDLPPLQAPENP